MNEIGPVVRVMILNGRLYILNMTRVVMFEDGRFQHMVRVNYGDFPGIEKVINIWMKIEIKKLTGYYWRG